MQKKWKPSHYNLVDPHVAKVAAALASSKFFKTRWLNDDDIEIIIPKGFCKQSSKGGLAYLAGYLIESPDDSDVFQIKGVKDVPVESYKCQNCSCGLKSCPLIVAAYLKYLRHVEKGEEAAFFQFTEAEYEETIEKSIEKLLVSEKLKRSLLDVKNHLQFVDKNKSSGVNLPKLQYAFAFLGSAGTGKFQAAKVVAKMMYAYGYWKSNKVTVIDYELNRSRAELETKFEMGQSGVIFRSEERRVG